MNKQNMLISGGIVLVIGIIIAIHGNMRSSSLEGMFTSLGGGTPPGAGEMMLGVAVGVAGLVILLIGVVKKESDQA